MVFSSVVHQGVEYQAEGGDTRHHAKQSDGLKGERYDLHGVSPVSDGLISGDLIARREYETPVSTFMRLPFDFEDRRACARD